MRNSFEKLLNTLTSLRPERFVFNFNSSSIYAEKENLEVDLKDLWRLLALQTGERLECCGKSYDGIKLRGTFYTGGVAVHLRDALSWHRSVIEAFAVLYDDGQVILIEGKRRRMFKDSFRFRGRMYLYGWMYTTLSFGEMFYRAALRATKRFAYGPDGFRRLNFPGGYNVILRIYREMPGWEREVRSIVESGSDTLRSSDIGVFRVGKFLIKVLGEDLLLIHEERAMMRVLYEKLSNTPVPRKRLLMPPVVGEVPAAVRIILKDVGFRFEGNRLVEVPAFWEVVNPSILQDMIRRLSGTESKQTLILKVAESLSSSPSLKPSELIMNLMLCNNPYQDPKGRVVIRRITREELQELLP
ncbi:MAG: hypothetical protein GXO39_09355 [Thermotogae bacterium]|nr:hypothetical protein [Thermotogota bacterium]